MWMYMLYWKSFSIGNDCRFGIWDAAPCSLIEIDRRFIGVYYEGRPESKDRLKIKN
jgi:hypothetical protein